MMADASSFAAAFDVSRETMDRLQIYAALLEKWNRRINLVAASTLRDVWGRHFIDSAAVYPLIPETRENWLDLGTGAGFPGMVLAIMASGSARPFKLTCVEADQRKAEFLRTVARATEVEVEVVAARIEAIEPRTPDAIFSRALASLDKLLDYSAPHFSGQCAAFFHKGRGWKKEVAEAREKWFFSCEAFPSPTQPDATILKIGDLHRA